MPLSALVGGMSGGPMIEYLGRRNTILGTGLPFIAGKLSSMQQSFSTTFSILFDSHLR